MSERIIIKELMRYHIDNEYSEQRSISILCECALDYISMIEKIIITLSEFNISFSDCVDQDYYDLCKEYIQWSENKLK